MGHLLSVHHYGTDRRRRAGDRSFYCVSHKINFPPGSTLLPTSGTVRKRVNSGQIL